MDESFVTEAVSIFDVTTSYTVSLPMLPLDKLATSSFGDKCTYNPETKFLSYSIIMTLADQQPLEALPGASPAFKAAVQSLFDMPRTFLKRYLGVFSPVEVQTPLSSMPTTFPYLLDYERNSTMIRTHRPSTALLRLLLLDCRFY